MFRSTRNYPRGSAGLHGGEDSGAALLLTQRAVLPRLPAKGELRRSCSTGWIWPSDVAGNPRTAARADNLAYVIYTWGPPDVPRALR